MSDILIDRSREQIAVVTINRPQRKNACDMAAWTDMLNAFADLRRILACGSQYSAAPATISARATTSLRSAPSRTIPWLRRAAPAQQECYAALRMRLFPSLPRFAAYASRRLQSRDCCDFGSRTRRARGRARRQLGLVYPTIQLERLTALIGVQQGAPGFIPAKSSAQTKLIARDSRRAHRWRRDRAAIAYGTPMLGAAHCPSRARRRN